MRIRLLCILVLSAFYLQVRAQGHLHRISDNSVTVCFRFDKVDIDSLYAGNRTALSVLNTLFTDSFRVSFIDSIHVSAYSSPEGRESYNNKLAQFRAVAMGKYLSERYPLLSVISLSLSSEGENWQGLRRLVSEDTCFNEREEVLAIIDKVHDVAKRERLLKRLNMGHAYKYLQLHIFPRLRNAIICSMKLNGRLKKDILQLSDSMVAKSFPENYVMTPASTHVNSSVLIQALKDYSVKFIPRRYSALKTNFVSWVMAATNLSYEVQVGKRFSLDLPLIWSSWDVTHAHALRIIAVQPEFRYWFVRPGCGHFFGVHVHAARYNVKWNDVRYQDTGKPLLGAGVSYGYLLPLNETWGMEFSLGAGYANTRYAMFHNTKNAPRFDTRTLRYWGITRLELSLIYKFSRP